MTDAPVQGNIDDFVAMTKPLVESIRAKCERRLFGLTPFNVTDAFAAQIIRACFCASMISDEGRWPRATLIACGGHGSSKHIARFETPVAADAPSIAKLAHTVTDWCRLGFADHDGTSVIVGIVPSMSILLGSFAIRATRTFGSLGIAIRGPGNVDVICEEGVLTYKAGIIFHYQHVFSSTTLGRLTAVMDSRIATLLGDDFQSRVHKGVEARLANVADPRMAELLRKELKVEVAADSKTQLVLRELAWRVSEMGHGGILIVTDHPDTRILSYKYRTKSGRLQNAVVRYWRAAYEDGSGTTRVPLSHSPGISLIHEAAMLRECLAATAQLAGTDGAIVLGTDFSLHGFGAIIDKSVVDESKVRFIDGAGNSISYESILANKGSRHHSALSFVMREEGTVVFVLSQDGHVTVLENHEGVVRVEKGLRVDGY